MSLDRPVIVQPDIASALPKMHRTAPIGVGVIGLGRAGCWHLERFGLGEVFSTISAWDDCQGAAHRAAGLLPRFAANCRDLINDPQIELVVVATPPAVHAALAIEALAAGKHILLETPCVLNSFEAEALLEAEQRSGRGVIVAHHRRWDADFRLARECLATGEIGDALRIKFVHWQYSLGMSPCIARQDGAFPDSHWRKEIATGGGMLWEFGIHRFDQLLLLAKDEPISVYARIDHAESRAVDTGLLAVIQFASGLEAHVELNRGIAAPLETGWVIAARHGSYVDGTRFTVTDEGEIVDVPVAASQAHDDFHAAVARHLRDEGPNPAPLAESLKTIELVEAVRASARTGMPVKLNG